MGIFDPYLGIKRGLDLTVSTAAILATAPLMAGIAASLRLTLGAPVLYGQTRPGLHEKPFRLWKFRTMTQSRDGDGNLLPDADRITGIGRWLRRHSLDELPQLFNVLRGEMSLVGPRPLLTRYLPRYSDRQRLRHRAKPGITGWAQVNGRNALDWTTRLEMDSWYAENSSLALDLKILVLTGLKIWQRGNVHPDAGAELDEFWGAAGPPNEGPRAFPVEEFETSLAPNPAPTRPKG